MKKIVKGLVLIVILLNIIACGGEESDPSSPSNNLTDNSSSETKEEENTVSQKKGLGALIPTEEMLIEVPVAMPPVNSYASNKLPSSFDLSNKMPPVRSQGGQGSCASWAVGYYLKAYHEHIDKDTDYGKENNYSGVYSPAFLYNSVKIGSCDEGSYIHENLDRVKDIGIASWEDMPYNENKCDTKPSTTATTNAKCARILDYQRIRIHEPIENIEMQDMKYYLSHGNPLVIGIHVYNGFNSPKRVDGEFIYKEYNENGYNGGHAIVVVGYDDGKNAFKIINSWGIDWGNDGFLWIDYDVFSEIVFVAYRTEDAIDECEESSSYISIDKQSLLFNTKPINSSYKKSFTISNSGSKAFDISNITTPSGYSVDWTKGTIKAGSSQIVTVTFSPTEDKSYNGQITIDHNADQGNRQIELIGSGVDGTNPNFPPIAKAGEDITVKIGESVKLDASKSTDDGTIISYEWKVGDSRLSNSKSFEKNDFSVGVHRVTLKVMDDKGLTDMDTVVITISEKDNLEPIADAGEDISVKFGDNITFNASKSTDSDGEIVAYEWKEGSQVLSNSSNFSKKDFSSGKHTITLTVTDDNGATDKDIIIVIVAKEGNSFPIANAGNDITLNFGDKISLDASKSKDSDGNIIEYKWSYNSSDNYTYHYTSTTPYRSFIPQRIFVGKTYIFTLTVKDNDGQIDTDTINVTVVGNESNYAPIAKIYYCCLIAIISPHETIKLDAKDSYDSDGRIVSYEWKEGDNILSTDSTLEKSDFSTGEHIVTLTVTDDKGAEDTDSITITVGRENNIAPIANAGENQMINLGDEVSLDASRSSDTDGSIIKYKWNYNNSTHWNTSPKASFTPNIENTGTYIVTLTVRDSDGGTDTDTMTLTVVDK